MDPLNDEAFFDDPILFPGSREGQTQTWLRGKDTPWTPFGDAAGISPIDVNAQTPDFITNCSNPSAFLDYRSAGIRSECETVPGDSGYGSMVFDNTSHYDEPFSNIPVQNLDQDIPEFKQISLGQPADHLYSQGGSQGGYLNPSSASEKKLFCQGCNTWVKTNSELKKHELRHTKPYRCNAGDCATKDRGFASQNDLTRHQMTVHRNHGLGKTYYCDVGECARRSKPWPRADNFRSHLQRVHKLEVLADADLSRYLHNQSRDQHPITEDLSGIGTQLQETSNTSVQHAADPNYSPQDPIKDFPDIDTQPTPHQLRAANQASIQDLISPNSQTVYSQSSVLEPGFEKYPFGNSLASVQPQSHSLLQHQTPRDLPKMEAVTPSHDNTSISQDVTEMDAESDDMSVSDDDLDIKRIQDSSLMKAASAGDRKTLLEALRKLPPRLLQEALDNTPGFEANADAASTSSKGGNKSHCNQCTKSFKRPCELRKHMKRHERPYGCTVRRCPKTFGSKNDWKRHERGQHNQAEVWSCDLDCSYFSYQRDELNSHLRVYHKLSNDRVINEKLDNNRRGGHCIDEFWCGFCRALVKMDLAKVGATETEESKSSIIDQRFNHIDHHFMGRDGGPRLDISHWCHPEDFFEKLLQPKRQAEHSRKRKGNQAHANPRPAKQVNTMTA